MAGHYPIDVDNHLFSIPSKQISQPSDLSIWVKSKAYGDIVGLISALNESVKDKKLSDALHLSMNIQSLLDLCDTIEGWISEFPPVDQPQRFGNKAFKGFYERLVSQSSALLDNAMGMSYSKAIPELSVYLNEAFGNATRIDYGTGHELCFIAFITCLYKIGFLLENDSVPTVFKLFHRYIQLCRKLQQTYRMEPAGSHGVWSLDDFQFVPFIWGSAQLINHKRIKPSHFPLPDYYGSFYKDYMFLDCIRCICSVKTGPFAEHSNQLWNISGVPEWSKVNTGLIKMYKAEVLAKFPVIQHFLFGSILTLEPLVDTSLLA